MSRSLVLALVLAPLVATACASSEAAPASGAKTASSTYTTGDYQALCVETMTRNRTCSDEYIPALVDSRARINQPPGIADEVKKDRNAVIEAARKEWAEDSTDANLARHCQQMTEHMDDSMHATADGAKACLAEQSCTAYVACVTPIFEKLMASSHH
jgi:hypothetical protein